MNLQEENKELRQKIQKYEEMLEEILSGPFYGGTVVSKSFNGTYRIAKETGEELLLAVDPRIEISDIKEGVKVMFNKDMIVRVLPKELEKTQPATHFDFIKWSDIGGLKSQVSTIRDTVELPIKHAEFYKEYGLSPSKGILLYGPPGCGKTMVAKAIASTFLQGKNITKDSFIYMKGGEMLSPYIGVAENNIKSVFDRARRNYKEKGYRSVIFIDEAEAILPARGSRRSSDVESTIVPTFLSEMDGFEDNCTFIILATNFPSQIDPAVIRPGRIDLKVEIGRPDYGDSLDIFRLYLSKTKCNITREALAEKATDVLFKSKHVDKVSGALIKNVVERATLTAIKRAVAGDNTGVSEQDLVNAINNL